VTDERRLAEEGVGVMELAADARLKEAEEEFDGRTFATEVVPEVGVKASNFLIDFPCEREDEDLTRELVEVEGLPDFDEGQPHLLLEGAAYLLVEMLSVERRLARGTGILGSWEEESMCILIADREPHTVEPQGVIADAASVFEGVTDEGANPLEFSDDVL
jgi:hypothetical protein